MDRQQDVKAWPGLKDPGLEANGFTANGREYTVAGSVSIDRWQEYEILQVEIGLARTFEQVQQQAAKAFDLCNQVVSGKPVFADLAIILRDLSTGAALVNGSELHPVLKMCALFINYKGEDTRGISDELIAEKVADWKEEGIAMTYFFRFAFHSIPGFVTAYRASSPGTSDRMEGVNQNGKTVSQDTNSDSPTSTHGPSSNA